MFIFSSDQTLDSLASANASSSIVDLLYAQDPGPGVKCQEILYEAYQHLGDVDALYGCGNSNLLVEHQRINHIIQEQKYFKAMSLIDIELVKGNFRHIKGQYFVAPLTPEPSCQCLLSFPSRFDGYFFTIRTISHPQWDSWSP